MIRVTTPYWKKVPHVMYNINDHIEAVGASTVAWFLFGDKWRAEPW